MTASPFPLEWPEHIDRAARQEKSQFRTSLSGALDNVRSSLVAFGRDSGKPVGDIVISSNVTLGADKPSDPGVAVWFAWDGMAVCIPVDRYTTPAENLQAIHHVLEARRTELRHGTLALVKASLRGFLALPPPVRRTPRRKWFEVLGVSEAIRDRQAIEVAFRERSKECHPDKPGGSREAFAALTAARDEGLRRAGA